MKYLNTYQIFESSTKIKNLPWDKLTELANYFYEGNSNWSVVINLTREYTNFNYSDIHDKILVALHNRNTIRKRITLEQKILMCLNLIRETRDKTILDYDKYDNFKDWYFNADITIYRSIPVNYSWKSGKMKPVFKKYDINQPTKHTSFSIIKDTAERFTNRGMGSKRNWS